jgi:hypothetical protein
LLRGAQDRRFVPVGHCGSNREYHSAVGVLEIILQGAFEQGGDLIGVVAERTTAPGAKDNALSLIFTGAARSGV